MENTSRILDRGLNAAVAHIAYSLAPSFRVAADAPHTYKELKQQIEGQGIVVVSSAASEQTIYGNSEINYAFRAWHDWCHWRGGHEFSLEGERAVARMQCAHLITLSTK